MSLKKFVFGVIIIFQLSVIYWLYKSHKKINMSKLQHAKKIAPIKQKVIFEDIGAKKVFLVGEHVSSGCTQRLDVELKVIYTLWGNINMPVHTITCNAIPNPQSGYFEISSVFFTRHKDERPVVKFNAGKKGVYYTLLLAESNVNSADREFTENKQELIHWVVLNIDGTDITNGVVDWQLHGSEIMSYKTPKVKQDKSTVAVYQLIVLEQNEFIKTIQSEFEVKENNFNVETFITQHELKPTAHVTFVVRNDSL